MLSYDEIIALIAAADTEYDAGEGGAIWPILFARHVQRAAYERAAQECETVKSKGGWEDYDEDYDNACRDCIGAIRALGRQQ